MKVLIAHAPSPSGWTKFHRDSNCSGLRKGEVSDGAEYVLRDLEDLPDTVKPCQFEYCFKGYSSASELKSKVHGPAKSSPARGVRVGQRVTFRELGSSEEFTRKIVSDPADASVGEISKGSEIAKALLGHEIGEVVEIPQRQSVARYEIVAIADREG